VKVRALAFALLIAGCSPVAAQPEARPALWKVADADTTIYLFGTIHLLPDSLKWQSPRIVAAERASSALVLETILDADPRATAAIMAALATSPRLPPVLDRVPADKRAALKAAADNAGLKLATLDGLETWAVALTLSAVGLRSVDATHESGVEQILLRQFRKARKPVSGLETPVEQLGMFDTLPPAAQLHFLLSVIDDKSDAQVDFTALITAWTHGDLAQIALSADDELKFSPELADALIRQRNLRWARWIRTRMARPGTIFVAVGAGHLAGPHALGSMLRAQGLAVTRLQ
jgi:uncharacterized protein